MTEENDNQKKPYHEHFMDMLGKQTADFHKPKQSSKKSNFVVKSQYGRISVDEDSTGAVRISQNGESIQIDPEEIQKLGGCLFSYRKKKYSQTATNNPPRRNQTSGSYMSKQKEEHANAYKPWTPEDDARLKELWEMGLDIKEIGEQMGRNEGSIKSRLKKKQLIK